MEVWLDAGRRVLTTRGVVAGDAIEEKATPLDPAFRFDAYHQLVVTKNAGRLEVMIDGVHAQTRELELAAGRVGLLARGGRADFDGVALTPHFRDAFSGPDNSWSLQGGSWLVDEGALHQGAGGAGRYVALKGDSASDYEFSASVRWRDNESVASTAGIVAAATAQTT